MARLLSCGFEVGSPSTVTLLGEDPLMVSWGGTATIAYSSSIKRSGAQALRVTTSSSTNGGWAYQWSQATTVGIFMRAAVYVASAGLTNRVTLISIEDNSTGSGVMIALDTTGNLVLGNHGTNAVLQTGPLLVFNTWYVLELSWVPSTGATAWRINGISQGSTTGQTGSSGTWNANLAVRNNVATSSAADVYYDDFAVNDDSGANQNSWPGMGQLVLLLPTADSARTGFTNGAAGTTGLWDATNNTPPVGVASGSSTATSQIKDATSSTTDNYQATLQTYSAAGVPAGATIVLVQGIANHGNSTTTSRTDGVQVLTNPTVAEATGATGTVAAATFPTGWTTLKTTVSYSPSVTLGTAPTMEFRKGTASTDVAMCDLMGLYVEFIPARAPELIGHRSPVRTHARRPLAAVFGG